MIAGFASVAVASQSHSDGRGCYGAWKSDYGIVMQCFGCEKHEIEPVQSGRMITIDYGLLNRIARKDGA